MYQSQKPKNQRQYQAYKLHLSTKSIQTIIKMTWKLLKEKFVYHRSESGQKMSLQISDLREIPKAVFKTAEERSTQGKSHSKTLQTQPWITAIKG